MTYHSASLEAISVSVNSADYYSVDELAVFAGERYQFSCDPDVIWHDRWVSANGDGYNNPLAALLGQRLRGAKCFCLCGVFDRDDSTAFAIGTSRYAIGGSAVLDIPADGKLTSLPMTQGISISTIRAQCSSV